MRNLTSGYTGTTELFSNAATASLLCRNHEFTLYVLQKGVMAVGQNQS